MGFISIHVLKLLHHTANIAEIQEFIVDETIRYQGIGKRLFQKAKEVGTIYSAVQSAAVFCAIKAGNSDPFCKETNICKGILTLI